MMIILDAFVDNWRSATPEVVLSANQSYKLAANRRGGMPAIPSSRKAGICRGKWVGLRWPKRILISVCPVMLFCSQSCQKARVWWEGGPILEQVPTLRFLPNLQLANISCLIPFSF